MDQLNYTLGMRRLILHYAGVEKQLYAQMKGILLMNQSPLQQWDTVQSSEKQVFTANNSITNNVLFL